MNYCEVICANLGLLKEKGHKISFEEGMFNQRNQAGFENVGHALLTVIDPVECKKVIPWPLLDTSAKTSFRTHFAKFIKMLNKKYPDARIPEITPSNLQNPGGENYLQLMFKLSTLAVKLELERMIGAEALNKVSQQPKPASKSKDDAYHLKIMLKVMEGVQYQNELSTQQLLEYEASATSKMQQIKSINEHLTMEIMAAQKNLEKEFNSLQGAREGAMTMQQDIDKFLSEWNIATEKKLSELEMSCEKVCRTRDMTVKSCQLVKGIEKKHADTLCLDGHQLVVPLGYQCDMLACSPVMNTQGQVKLEILLKAGAVMARKLAPYSPPVSQTPILPLAHSLLTNVCKQEVNATQNLDSLLRLCTKSEEVIEENIPIIKAKLEDVELPDHLKYLDDRPPLQFIFEESITNQPPLLQRRQRMSLNSMVNLHRKKGKKVVCSIRKRRSVSKYSFEQTPKLKSPSAFYQLKARSVAPRFGFRIPSTCVSPKARVMAATSHKSRHSLVASRVMASTVKKPNEKLYEARYTTDKKDMAVRPFPACKKSIYGKLPVGSRDQDTDEFAELPLNDSLVTEHSFFEPAEEATAPQSTITYNKDTEELAERSEEATTRHKASQNTNTKEKVVLKKTRKSISDIVERYKKIKNQMKK